MTQSVDPYGAAPTEQPSGVSGALQRQIGPLKAWQWGIVVGGAVLLYYLLKGRSSSGTTTTDATVPFTSGSNGSSGSDNGGGTNPITTVVQNAGKLLYYSAHLKNAVKILDKNGKVVGTLTAGRTLLLGIPVKINGRWYYPIINMPNRYLLAGGGPNSPRAGSGFTITPIFGPGSTTTTTTSAAIAAPVTTQTAQPYFNTTNAVGSITKDVVPPSAPSIDPATMIDSHSVQLRTRVN